MNDRYNRAGGEYSLEFLKGAISQREEELNRLYHTVGKAYYEEHRNDPDAIEWSTIQRISAVHEEIAGYRDALRRQERAEICPNCGHNLLHGSAFCAYCGYQLNVQSINYQQESVPVICTYCGAGNDAQSRFCSVCGHSFYTGERAHSERRRENGTSFVRSPAFLISAVVAIAIILGVVIYSCFGHLSVINTYIKASENFEFDKIVKLIPEPVLDYMEHEQDVDVGDLIDRLEDRMEDYLDELDGNWKLSYKVVRDETITGYELNELKEQYDEIYTKIDGAKEVKIKLSVTYDGETKSDYITIALVRIGLTWYLDPLNMSMNNIYIQ